MIGTARDCLAGGAAVRRRHVVAHQEVVRAGRARSRGQRTGIGVAIGLAVRVRGPGRVALVDGEACARVGDVVVIQHPGGRAQRRRDVVGTARHRLTGGAAVGRRHVVGSQEVVRAGQIGRASCRERV